MDEKKKKIDDDIFNAAVSTIQSGAGAAPQYAGTFDQQIKDTYEKIANREPFSYDVNADPLYQQYKDKYIQNGKLAMRDTMGKAAGLTGGYGSSYAAQVGQQSYDAQLQNLSNAIPELYGLAQDKYDREGNALKDQMSMLQNLQGEEYDRYRDDVADWRYGQELDRANEQRDYERRMAEDQTAYTRQQNAYSQMYGLIMGVGYNPTDDEIAAAGMTRQQVNALLAYYRSLHPEASAAAGGSSGGGGRVGSITGNSSYGKGRGAGITDWDNLVKYYDSVSEETLKNMSPAEYAKFQKLVGNTASYKAKQQADDRLLTLANSGKYTDDQLRTMQAALYKDYNSARQAEVDGGSTRAYQNSKAAADKRKEQEAAAKKKADADARLAVWNAAEEQYKKSAAAASAGVEAEKSSSKKKKGNGKTVVPRATR